MRTETNKYIELPVSLGSEEYEKRGINDREIRYKPYNAQREK